MGLQWVPQRLLSLIWSASLSHGGSPASGQYLPHAHSHKGLLCLSWASPSLTWPQQVTGPPPSLPALGWGEGYIHKLPLIQAHAPWTVRRKSRRSHRPDKSGPWGLRPAVGEGVALITQVDPGGPAHLQCPSAREIISQRSLQLEPLTSPQ